MRAVSISTCITASNIDDDLCGLVNPVSVPDIQPPRHILNAIPPTDPAGLLQFNARHASHHLSSATKLLHHADRLASLAAGFGAPPPRQYYAARLEGWQYLVKARALMRVATHLNDNLDDLELRDDRGIVVGAAKRRYLRRRVGVVNEILEEKIADFNKV
ncbi:uncharacterized protein CcaverHIS019_0102410 [Cutaneotrichosporon cavernicola]|uniref:Uncharacterized protein n=1 Tax=Cutaneotrichosporon cavernicola TaxID=279322 RepID=A0AA48ID56_9TREE|nr:uncharacterized protein CcaverHIS019_0102410 [Cutaneotrichosporon cavernicola]BEI87523.1 hypothetical protein CcaverHIS019_0102410 [Cutaneotrichosporon cavernicola]